MNNQRKITIEVEVAASEDYEYDTDKDLALHFASSCIGNDFDYVAIKFNGEEI